MFLANCPSGDEVTVEGVSLLADCTKHCETSCKRGVTLCNASKIRCSVAALVAKVELDSTSCNACCNKNVARLDDCGVC